MPGVDLAIYSKPIWDLRPGAPIEIGTHSGGSALWFRSAHHVFARRCEPSRRGFDR
jgi:cephalosporin hydroxylase